MPRKKPEPKPRGVGRPPKEIKKDQFEALCRIQCTYIEICDVLNVSDKTLYNWCKTTYGEDFSVTYKRFASQGRVSLRRTQFKLAEKSAGMAIFLGKNMLGQRDRFPEDETKEELGKTLVDAIEAAYKARDKDKEDKES